MIKIKSQIIFYTLFFLIICLIPVLAQAVEYTGKNYRNPLETPLELTKPLKKDKTTKKVELPAFEVQGMVWGGKRPQAVINGQVLEKGDIIQGAEIMGVCKRGVIFLYQNEEFIVRPVIGGRTIGEKP
ncbi:MAG: hypothetical protein U9R31_03295 [Candidatus Omnitrophota bacterium]|nr:hypothetical protein [Candidatus Omnitrophota bacterium]